MTKINIESKKAKPLTIPVQIIGGLALKEERRTQYARRHRAQDHGVAANRNKEHPRGKSFKSLADRRAEVLDRTTDLSPEELESLTNEILERNGYDENGQPSQERVAVLWSSQDDADSDIVQNIESLMGVNTSLDEQIRNARHDLKRQREKADTNNHSPDDDPTDYTLDGFSVRGERPGQ